MPRKVPESLEDSGRQHCFDTAPEELDKILDPCHIVFGPVFVVRVVKLFEPGLITGNIYDRLQDIEIVNGPGIDNVYAEVEIAMPENFSAALYGFLGYGIGLINAFCQHSDILGVVGHSFKIAVALIGVPDVVA